MRTSLLLRRCPRHQAASLALFLVVCCWSKGGPPRRVGCSVFVLLSFLLIGSYYKNMCVMPRVFKHSLNILSLSSLTSTACNEKFRRCPLSLHMFCYVPLFSVAIVSICASCNVIEIFQNPFFIILGCCLVVGGQRRIWKLKRRIRK